MHYSHTGDTAMTDHDKLIRLLEKTYLAYDRYEPLMSTSATFDFLLHYYNHWKLNNSNGEYYLTITGYEWDGRTYESLQIAVLSAMLGARGLSTRDYPEDTGR
jgi:predicted transcriptional regulator